jgi:multiple antibiotic resistance protein
MLRDERVSLGALRHGLQRLTRYACLGHSLCRGDVVPRDGSAWQYSAVPSVLKTVPSERRRTVLLRELIVAYVVLILFLLTGRAMLAFLGLDQEAVSIAGGTVLFLIALRMIFPGQGSLAGDPIEGEPFIVPLAIPLIAGPSTLATLLLLQTAVASSTMTLLLVVTITWLISGSILLSATFLYRVLGERGLIAMERLMGMLLVMVAVQMLMDGITSFMQRLE